MSVFRKKNYLTAIVVYASILLVYVLVPLLVPFEKGVASWIIYGATIFSLVVSFIVLFISFGNKTTIRSLVYGVPVFRVGIIYFILHIIASIAVFIVDALVGVPFWISLIVVIVLLALCVIGVAITDTQRRMVEQVEEIKEKSTSKYDQTMQLLDELIVEIQDPSIKEEVLAVKDSFKYADPVSNEKSREIELELEEHLKTLISFAKEGENEKLSEGIGKLKQLIAHRNNAVRVKTK